MNITEYGTIEQRPSPQDAAAFIVTTPASVAGLYLSNGQAWTLQAGNGTVQSVTAADASIAVVGSLSAPTVKTATLDVIASTHPPAAAVAMNGQKITGQANGTVATDSAAFGQIPSALPPNGPAGGALTGTYPNPTLPAVGPGATGPIGSSTLVPIITIDAQGRVTALSSASLNVPVQLVPTAVKTGNYTAGAGDYVPCDTTSGPFTITLPTTPADKTCIAVNLATRGGSNIVTVAAGGSDVIGKAGGPSTYKVTIPTSTVILQYSSPTSLWIVESSQLTSPQQRRTGTVASSATPTINTDTTDFFSITALAVAITSMTTNLAGTPVDSQTLWIAITDNGTARAIAWGASFEASTIALPVTTVAGARLDVGLVWNVATSKWRCVAVA